MSLNVLALDAACGGAAAALLRSDQRYFVAESEGGSPHSQAILPLLAGLLDQARLTWSQLDVLVAGIGPGSFTGLRVACATFAGLNTAVKLPVLGVSSLAITAAQAAADGPVWVLEDARSGDGYVGRYHAGKPLQEDACLTWDAIGRLPAGPFVGHSDPPVSLPGWTRLDCRKSRASALCACLPDTLAGGIAGAHASFVLPSYLRASQAEMRAG